jgi:hypothetical protein
MYIHILMQIHKMNRPLPGHVFLDMEVKDVYQKKAAIELHWH